VIQFSILILVGLAAAAMTLNAARHLRGDRYLCDTCKYNSPDKCFKKERPAALICYAFKE
jgi:hypothetical protein